VTAVQGNIAGICGAPCTGKTTLAQAILDALKGFGLGCELLPEPARRLVEQGAKIDREMGEDDYNVFLAAYIRRDRRRAPLCIADRTPLDHYCYLAVNQGLSPKFIKRHHDTALAAAQRYRLLLYLPIEFPIHGDEFRTTDPEYRTALDAALRGVLGEVAIPRVAVRGSVEERQATALDAVMRAWPELFLSAHGGS
jgi:nicotinamide riboside kinase